MCRRTSFGAYNFPYKIMSHFFFFIARSDKIDYYYYSINDELMRLRLSISQRSTGIQPKEGGSKNICFSSTAKHKPLVMVGFPCNKQTLNSLQNAGVMNAPTKTWNEIEICTIEMWINRWKSMHWTMESHPMECSSMRIKWSELFWRNLVCSQRSSRAVPHAKILLCYLVKIMAYRIGQSSLIWWCF